MDQLSGTRRPGGRTARTRDRVHAAVRELLARPGSSTPTIAAVASGSGVNATTIYRRWGSIESLVLDVAVDDANHDSPLAVTGDLRADLAQWAHRLVQDVSQPEGLRLFRAIIAAAATPVESDDDLRRVSELVQPRLDLFAKVLEASGTQELTPDDVVNLVLSPIYVAAVFAPSGQLTRVVDVDQLIDNLLAVREHRAAAHETSASTERRSRLRAART